MNMVLIDAVGLSFEVILSDERLGNLGQLVQVSCYGQLNAGNEPVNADPMSIIRHGVEQALPPGAWRSFSYPAAGDSHAAHSADAPLALDQWLGVILESLDEATSILLISREASSDPTHGVFVLFLPGLSSCGELVSVTLDDLMVTILEAAGATPAAAIAGRSLFAVAAPGPSALSSADEEQLLRERLRGLGYIE